MKIEIIGTGNVGSHLAEAFRGKADANLVPSRTFAGLRPDSDLYLICVSDSAIRETAERLAAAMPRNAVAAHTSGCTGLDALPPDIAHRGVFYPLQTFTKGVELDYSRIPFFIEGDSAETAARLKDAALLVSGTVVPADSATRRDLHIASVTACNFANHVWALSNDFIERSNQARLQEDETACMLRPEMLWPLLDETLRKSRRMPPKEAQTGPAVRGDEVTLNAHAERIKALYGENSNLLNIYQTLSKSIQKTK